MVTVSKLLLDVYTFTSNYMFIFSIENALNSDPKTEVPKR